ncbi:MAG: molybdate ABC transporter substrate-binding protein [Chitinivibrionales bacterium]|nr:molybdate ABC transporter substrate-binding protein [Chitinivibrionales bacterium]MBD3358256.1 molybdate ABC transporter substrate-binding protein [Chitinivibrionales bacterium]
MKRPVLVGIVVLLVIGGLVTGLRVLRGGGGAGSRRGSTDLVVYCAAGLKPALEPLVEEYQKRYNVDIQVQYAGSGTLLSNLQVAKSGDLYLAADAGYLEIARKKGLVDEVLPLAHMRPVIAVSKGNPLRITGVEELSNKKVRVALANPDAASIGKQTRSILQKAGLWEALEANAQENGVFKPTVNEVANDVKLGSVDAGVIWDATANFYPEVEAVHVPVFDSAVKEVQVGVLKASQQPTATLRLARFLNSTEGNRVFRRMGFDAIDGDKWEWSPEITFYCGAVNRRAVEEVVKAFEDREGVTVNTVYNGCGILTAQMRTINQKDGSGFPDVYMACDRYYLETVKNWFQEDRDISDADIVIAVPEGNPKNIRSLRDLTKPGMRVAVGQPEQCTIGALTRIMLRKMGIYEQLMPNVVTQTASSALLVPSVVTKSVDAAIAYGTDTKAEADKIDEISIDSPYAKAVQPFSIARSSEYKYLSRRLFEDILNAREAFTKAGFHFLADSTEI